MLINKFHQASAYSNLGLMCEFYARHLVSRLPKNHAMNKCNGLNNGEMYGERILYMRNKLFEKIKQTYEKDAS